MADMLFRFQSRSSAELVLLEATAHAVFQALDKPVQPQGVWLAADLPAIQRALEAGIAEQEAQWDALAAQAQAEGRTFRRPSLGLRQRWWPLLQMVQRATAHRHDITWGV